MDSIHIVGAGLAGSECALQLAKMIRSGQLGQFKRVVLHEMRGGSSGLTTPAHQTKDFAELVCSNSFGSIASHSAAGLLKWEAEQLGSFVLTAAIHARVPAGQALALDRHRFAQNLTQQIESTPEITVIREPVLSIDDLPRPAVIATGPLTHEPLAHSIASHFSSVSDRQSLYFFDAIAPIVSADSINSSIAWKGDRWDRGTRDYWNCPMSKEEYGAFLEALTAAKTIEPKDFEKDFEKTPYFESCMPIEALLARGPQTLRFGPMSPKGLKNPHTGRTPYAVVQLRQDNTEGTAFNMVGFQTKMAYGAQKQVFRMIPGLEDAEFLKLGSIHRNLYINTPKLLNWNLSSKKDPLLFFAGQITGVEGYFESTCIGLLVSRFLQAELTQLGPESTYENTTVRPPRQSALGSLLSAITDPLKADHFQPTNINFGHLPEVEAEPGKRIPKDEKRRRQILTAKEACAAWIGPSLDESTHQIDKLAKELEINSLLAKNQSEVQPIV